MFLDESTHKLDAKGRVFCPKRFQDVLQRDPEGSFRCVLCMGFDGCLFLFSVGGFQEAAAKLVTEAFVGSGQREAQRWFFSNSTQVTLDSSGRLLIPEKMRAHAGLSQEVAMIGAFDRAEVWDVEKWGDVSRKGAAHFETVDRLLAGGHSDEA